MQLRPTYRTNNRKYIYTFDDLLGPVAASRNVSGSVLINYRAFLKKWFLTGAAAEKEVWTRKSDYGELVELAEDPSMMRTSFRYGILAESELEVHKNRLICAICQEPMDAYLMDQENLSDIYRGHVQFCNSCHRKVHSLTREAALMGLFEDRWRHDALRQTILQCVVIAKQLSPRDIVPSAFKEKK